jgi:chromate transporter
MVDQFVARPTSPKQMARDSNIIKINRQELLTGAGLVRAIPGPVFSIASYTGGLALKNEGKDMQLLGCVIGSTAIFLPSALLILFFFPVWQYLKNMWLFIGPWKELMQWWLVLCGRLPSTYLKTYRLLL